MNVRKRNEIRSIKIGVMELYCSGLEDAIRPIEFDTVYPQSMHSRMVVDIIREFVPNAEIYLVPATLEGMQCLIDNEVVIVNMSASCSYDTHFEDDLAKHAFLVTSAGNKGDQGETWSARQEFWCAVAAIDQNLEHKYSSSYGFGSVVTAAQIEWETSTGIGVHGTSGASPIIVGLLAQWYIWFHDLFGTYPSVEATYDFIKQNSHDIWSESDFNKIGYGLLRLPHKFEATSIKISTNNQSRYTIQTNHKEDENPKTKQVDLLSIPRLENGRTIGSLNGFITPFGLSVFWNQDEFSSYYVK